MRLAIMTVCLVACCLVTAQDGIEQEDVIFFRGDVNASGDGENPSADDVDISDVIYLSAWLNSNGPPPPYCPYEVGDFNADGWVSSADVTAMTNWLFNGCGSCIGSPTTIYCDGN